MRSVSGRHDAARRLVLVLSAFFLLASSAYAATLSGRIVDPDGRAVPGARVIVSGPVSTLRDIAADGSGAFAAADLPAGRYVVRVIADGFQADPVDVVLDEAATREITVALRVSALSESLVVSAAQVDVPLSQTPDSVTVIARRELEARQIETVADALRAVPGLAVARSGGRGAITSIFPRGGNSNYTLVLVDGIRANAFGGGYDFARLPVGNVDRIEVVRGPQSALFGSDAIGGVINIITRRGGPTRGDALFEGGSQSTTRASASAAGSAGAWSWGGGAEHTRSDGFTGLAPATGERVSNDDYRLSQASGTLGWQGRADVLISGDIERDERGFPGPFGSNPIGAFPGVDRVSRGVNDTRQIGARVTHPWTARLRQRIDANYTDVSGSFTSAYGPSTSGTRRFDGRVQEDAAFTPAVAASVGVELTHERGNSSYITGTAGALPIDRNVVGSFAEVRYVGSERLFVTGGARLEHVTRDALAGSADPYSPRPAFAAQTVDSFNPKIAVSYRFGGGGSTTRLHASAGTGIRPPDAFEIAFTDNPNLRPERSRSIDAGVEQQFASGRVAVGATAFFNRYDDLIVTVGRVLRDASHYRTDNISNAQARGLELTANARVAPGLTLSGSYTFLASEVLSVDGLGRVAPPPFVVGDPLIRRPRHTGAAGLTYAAGRVAAFGELTTRSRALDVEPSYGSFGGLFFSTGYVVANAGASVRVVKGFDVYARVMNLANRSYEETLGYPALPRSLVAGVRVAAGR